MIMKKTLLALIVILALASMTMGTTFAGFSDTEEVTDNTFESGSLDLKVARCVGGCGDPVFCDDQPWGTGLFPVEIEPDVFEIVPCFMAEEDEAFDPSYTRNFRLWNPGCIYGKFYVHIRGVGAEPPEHAAGLLDGTTVTLWYDQNDDDSELNSEGEIDEEEVVVGTLGGLNCQPVPQEPVVWLLPANELRNLQIVIDPPDGAPGDSLTFHIQFGLKGILFVGSDMVNIGFCDTEICLDNCLKVKEE